MTEKRTGILPSDMDAQGNVTLWDHGPRDEAEAKAWHETHGDGPVAVVMFSSDAGHAMTVDPDRYALEPDELDEDEIKKRMDEMKAKRLAAANHAQDVIDRRVAIASIVSDKAQARLVAQEKPEPEPIKEPEHKDPL